jgi:hypothetical protein
MNIMGCEGGNDVKWQKIKTKKARCLSPLFDLLFRLLSIIFHHASNFLTLFFYFAIIPFLFF